MKSQDIKKIQQSFMDSFNEFSTHFYSLEKKDLETTYKLSMQLENIGMDYLLAVAKSCKFKDTFEAFYTPGFLDIQIKSTKTGSEYHLRHDYIFGKIEFESYIDNPEYIKNLQDDFILEFFFTCSKYGFKYEDNCGGTSGKSIFNASIKSNIFRLFRNYTNYVVSNEEGLDVFQNVMFGSFKKEWVLGDEHPLDISQLHEELCIAMKYFYKFNYYLWKAKQNNK